MGFKDNVGDGEEENKEGKSFLSCDLTLQCHSTTFHKEAKGHRLLGKRERYISLVSESL